MINKNSNVCRHHPSAQINGLLRFGEFIFQRNKALNKFRCYFCGCDLQIPQLYENPFLKIGYACFSIPMTLGIVQLKNAGGFLSEIPIMILISLVYLLMFFLQRLVSAAILAFSCWEQSKVENNAQTQLAILKKHNDDNCSAWLLGISLCAGYIVGFSPWILLALLLIFIGVTIFRNR